MTVVAREPDRRRHAIGTAPRGRVLAIAVILLAPLIGVALLQAPLINAVQYRDPWFYSGYGWSLAHHVEVFGWFYYSVRFPAILPIAWSTSLLGPTAGYIVVRYLVLAATGALLYACLRRFASRSVACAGVLLLALSPFYVRMVLWDYTPYIGLPCTIAAAAAWHLGATRRAQLWSAAATGVFVGGAVFSNPICWILIPALYGVEALAALRERGTAIRWFLVRAAVSVLGAALVFLAGYLGYRASLGNGFAPRDLVQPTLDFARENSKLSASFQVPARTWLAHEPRVYAPPLICLATVLVMGRGFFANTSASRVAQFAVAYTVGVWLSRKMLTSSIIETWWAYNLTAVTPCFALPVMLHTLVHDGRRLRVFAGASVAAAALGDLLLRGFDGGAVRVYEEVRTHLWLLLLLLAVTAAAALAMRWARGAHVRAAGVAVLTAGWVFFSLAPADHLGIRSTGEFSTVGGQVELDAYDAAYRITDLLEGVDQPTSRVMLWSTLVGASNIGWVNLPHQQGGINDPEEPAPLGELTPSALSLLEYPTTHAVLILADDARERFLALRRLRTEGLDPRVRRSGTWADGRLHYALVDVGSKR